MDTSNRNLRILVTLFGLFFVVLVLFSIRNWLNSRPLQQVTVPSSLASATAFGPDSLVYANGQALDAYNYTSGVTTPLSTTGTGIGTIDTVSVSPNDKYVVFHDEHVDPAGSMATQLRSQGLSLSADYWWLFDTQNKTFLPLPQGALLAKVDNSNVYTLTYGSSGESITTYQASNLQKTNSTAITGSSNFIPIKGGFLLQTGDNRVLLTTNGVVSNQLLTGATLIGATADGQTGLAVVSQNGSRNLVSFNTQGATTTIASGIVNLPAWLSSDDMALYLNNRGGIYSYNVATKQSKRWVLSSSTGANTDNVQLTALLNDSTALIRGSSNGYYLVGKNLSSNTIN